MPRKTYRIWSAIERTLGCDVRPAIRRTYEAEFEDAELELIVTELPHYLAQFPSQSRNSPSTVYVLGRLIRSGEWRKPEPVALEPERFVPPLRLELQPVGFVDDDLVSQMPTLVQCMVEARLEGTGICVDYAIAGSLAQLAAVCGNRLKFRAWSDYHFVNLYLVLVGDTGKSFKSSVLKQVKAALSDVDSRCLAADEGSVEALIKDLAEYPARLWIRDEFAGLLAAIKGVDYLKPVRELLLSLYDHTGIYRRHLTRTSWECHNPALSFLATIQPAVMGEELFSGRNVDSGFVNRLLLIPGDGVLPYWPAIQDYSILANSINGRLRALLDQPAIAIDVGHLSAAAQVWNDCEEEAFGPYGGWVAKRAALQALKIATIFEAAEGWPAGKRVNPKWLDVALGLLERWYKNSVAVIADVHIRQAGERDRRDFFALICHHSHNKIGPVAVGKLTSEAQLSKRRADEYVVDLIARGWVSEDDNERLHCTRESKLCEKKGAK